MGTVNGLDGRMQEGEDEALFGNGDAEERTGNGHSEDNGEMQDVDNWWEAIEGSGVMEGDARGSRDGRSGDGQEAFAG